MKLDVMNKNNCRLLFGVLLFVLGTVLVLTKTLIIELISTTFVLKPNSLIEINWRRTPELIPTNVYLFNWTNSEDIHNISIKPKFEEVGPYCFLQDMKKVDVVWNDNDTVTFRQVRTWSFDEEHTNGSLNDSITTLNAISMTTAHFVRYWSYFMRRSVSAIISSFMPEIPLTKTADEFLFAGYQDLVMDAIAYLPFLAPEAPRLDKFGWFRLKNGSAVFDGVFNMANGVNGHFDVLNWNYYNETPYYDAACAIVHGSSGELYERKITRDHVGVFYSDLCRYLVLDYEEDVDVHGILGYKFKVGDSVLDNGTLIPGNECYCSGDCMPSGMLNASSCKYGFPAYLSLPHFYGGDSVYLDAMEGVEPEKSKHETFIILEPTTGAMLQASLRIQLNILLHPVQDIDTYENVREIFFPVFWAEQIIEIPGHLLPLLKIFLNTPLIFTILSNVMIVAGLGLLIFVLYKPISITICERLHRKEQCRSFKPEQIPLHSDKTTHYVNNKNNNNCR